MKTARLPLDHMNVLPNRFGELVGILRRMVPHGQNPARYLTAEEFFNQAGLTLPSGDFSSHPDKAKTMHIGRLEREDTGLALSMKDIERMALFLNQHQLLDTNHITARSEDGLTIGAQFFRLAIEKLEQQRYKNRIPKEDYAGREALLAVACKHHLIQPSERDRLGEMLGIYEEAKKDHAAKPATQIHSPKCSIEGVATAPGDTVCR